MYKEFRFFLLFCYEVTIYENSEVINFMEDFEIQAIEAKKRALKKYKKNIACIERLEDKLATLDERIKSVKSPNYSGMPRGGKPITTADLIAEKLELEERINNLVSKRNNLKREILEELDTLEDPRHIEVLEGFFIDCKRLEDIAEDKGYTVRHVYRLYSEGVKLLTKIEVE